MTPLEDKLRAAIRETADEIGPGTVPPLRLRARRRRSVSLARGGGERNRTSARRDWRGWVAPAASAVLVAAVVAGSLALSHLLHGRQAPGRPQDLHQSRQHKGAPVGHAGIPRYYVALAPTGGPPGAYPIAASAAVIRATATGAVIARIAPPEPYGEFIGVTAAADDRTFVLAAQARAPRLTAKRQQWLIRHNPGQLTRDQNPATRFFVLRFDPASRARGGLARLTALPAGYVPAGMGLEGLALSSDGSQLAATIGQLMMGSRLYVFDLATGTERMWSSKLCGRCLPGGIGFGFGGVNVGSLSWAADSRTLAFTWAGSGQGDVRLLDTAAPGTSLLADSKLAIATPNGPGPYWRAAIITPDGRTIAAVRELTTPRPGAAGVRQELVKFSAVTGKVTAILNHLPVRGNYQQVLWASSSGHVLIVTGARPGASAGILRGDHYTPIPWSSQNLSAAW